MVWLVVWIFLVMASLPDEEGRILVNLSSDSLRQQPCLQFETASIAGLGPKNGMLYLLVKPLFKLGEEKSPLVLLEPIAAQFHDEICGSHHPMIEDLYHDRVNNGR